MGLLLVDWSRLRVHYAEEAVEQGIIALAVIAPAQTQLIGSPKSSEAAMTNKQNFTPEEWTKLLESPMAAGIAVSAAEPSGLWGTLKEAFASSSALASAKLRSDTNELVKAVIADFETSEGRADAQKALRARFAGSEPHDCVDRSLANLREVSAILDAKAPGDATAFKAWLRDISQKVAEAADEGGFMGIGGVKVSEAEKATLADIAKALGT